MKNKIIGGALIIAILAAITLGLTTKHMEEGLLIILLIRLFLPILITDDKKEEM